MFRLPNGGSTTRFDADTFSTLELAKGYVFMSTLTICHSNGCLGRISCTLPSTMGKISVSDRSMEFHTSHDIGCERTLGGIGGSMHGPRAYVLGI